MSYNNQGFFYNFRQTVYKWWCVVYKPAYKLFHHGYWPAEKEPYYQPPAKDKTSTSADKLAQVAASTDAEALANKILSSKQGNVDAMVANTTPVKTDTPQITNQEDTQSDIDLSQVDPDALARANEIMARLASEAAADEAKKQAEIDAAKAKARADENAAKAKAKADEDAAKARADEIMARLAAEAAEDEAKKQAEIDAAKAKAKEDERLASILKSTKVDISAYIEEGKAQRQDTSS